MFINTIIIGLLIFLQTFHKGWDTDAASHNINTRKKSKSASVRSTKCAYTIVVNEVDASQCPVMTQPVQSDHTADGKAQKKSTVSSSEVHGLTSKIHSVETTLLGEIVKNRELNTTLTHHSIMLQKAEDRFLKYQNNFTSLFRAIMFMEQKIRKQKEISRNLDNKLSNIMLDVVEVNNVLSRKTPGPGTSLKDKQIKVESAAHVRQCGITDDTDIFQDCQDVYERGHTDSSVYYIKPTYSSCPIPVWCDMDTPPGGWLVIQRRLDGKLSFNQDWKTYKDGFGDVIRELWLGNDNIFLLTNQAHYQLRIDLWDFQGNRVYAIYETFKIDGERDSYKLNIGKYKGSAKDSFGKHNGLLFSTSDKDNDKWSQYHCAKEWEAGWWFTNCWFAILNGPYYEKANVSYRGISWNEWKHEQLKKTEMKIQPFKS
ncbi:techylectin-5B [Octopus bimaculoides]|uniref:Fibrinogen C-terminal domain-containing protein n=1 Tax=Octopus bimaculoides TaxID=37653 RepID=A0A0L8HDR8_OCTBM|nr:techylectin-5B [Octopus bimaculoides]|eukprot:XP_014773323.1 PREDICTED: techylectin-5B-like [Octopus bimaculoides]